MQKATSSYITIALVASLVVSIECQVSVPGVKTAAGVIAASTDGVSRYLANDGPIQPAITAIAGLPLRGGDVINRGIGSISSTMSSGAQSMARRAGNDGTIRMPGMQTLRDNMPGPLATIGNSISSGISYKNSAIMNQAKRGIEAGNRLAGMMSGSVKSINPMHRRRQDRNNQQDQSSNSNDDQDQQQRDQNQRQQNNNRRDRRQRRPFDQQQQQENQEQNQGQEQPDESANNEDFSKKGQGFRPDLVLDNTDEEDGPSVKAPSSRGMNQQPNNQFDGQPQQFDMNNQDNGNGHQGGRRGGFNQQQGGGRQRGRRGGRGDRNRQQGGDDQQQQDMNNQDNGNGRRGGRRGGFNQQQGDDQQQQFGRRGGRRDFQRDQDQQQQQNDNNGWSFAYSF